MDVTEKKSRYSAVKAFIKRYTQNNPHKYSESKRQYSHRYPHISSQGDCIYFITNFSNENPTD